MKRFVSRRFITVLSFLGLAGLPGCTLASSFQVFEQDAASVGNYHAGYAAKADDASASFYNPAGIVRIKNQQLVFGGNAFFPSFKYVGSMTVNSIEAGNRQIPLTAQGGAFLFAPFLHYVAPISDVVYFGFSVDAPFGLKSNYGHSTDLQYVATLSSVTVIDYSPVLAFQFNDKLSFGIGPDIQSMYTQLNSVGTMGGLLDTEAKNRANDTGYGFHAGLLYQFTPGARAGLSYHSQVVHHLSGSSKFIGPLANFFNDDVPINSSRMTTNITLPPYTALSGYYRINPCFAVMGSVIYTQWNILQNLILNDVAGLAAPGPVASTSIQVTTPTHYTNTLNFALGADFNAAENIILRGGIGYDQSPVRNEFRTIQLPDSNRYIIALGGHYQITQNVGADLSWMHIFTHRVYINPAPQVMGAQTVTTNGHISGAGADVIGGQVVWDMM